MDTKKLKNEFEAKFYAAKSDKNLSQLKTCFLMPFFKTASDSYKKSCMDNLVTSGYENPEFAKWSLTTTDVEFNGDIHKNADRPLRLAAQFNIEFAKYLLTSPDLKEKANINETNDGSSVLLEAIKCNNLEFVNHLALKDEASRILSLS